MEELEKLASESLKLDNRLRRYWNKLVTESLKIAKQRKLNIGVIYPDATSSEDIVIIKNGKEVNAYDLLKLSKNVLPSLYRKYNQGLEKHHKLHKELETLLVNVDKDCY